MKNPPLPKGWKIIRCGKTPVMIREDGSSGFILGLNNTVDSEQVAMQLENYGYPDYSKKWSIFATVEALKASLSYFLNLQGADCALADGALVEIDTALNREIDKAKKLIESN